MAEVEQDFPLFPLGGDWTRSMVFGILIAILVYARALGTEELTGGQA